MMREVDDIKAKIKIIEGRKGGVLFFVRRWFACTYPYRRKAVLISFPSIAAVEESLFPRWRKFLWQTAVQLFWFWFIVLMGLFLWSLIITVDSNFQINPVGVLIKTADKFLSCKFLSVLWKGVLGTICFIVPIFILSLNVNYFLHRQSISFSLFLGRIFEDRQNIFSVISSTIKNSFYLCHMQKDSETNKRDGEVENDELGFSLSAHLGEQANKQALKNMFNDLANSIAKIWQVLLQDQTVGCAIRIAIITHKYGDYCKIYRTVGRSTELHFLRRYFNTDVKFNEGLPGFFSGEVSIEDRLKNDSSSSVPIALRSAGVIFYDLDKAPEEIFKWTPSESLHHISSLIAVPILSKRSPGEIELLGLLYLASPYKGTKSPFRGEHVLLLRSFADYLVEVCRAFGDAAPGAHGIPPHSKVA